MKAILLAMLLLTSNSLFASCRSFTVGKQITVTGWTPDEAYEKLHLELPKLGVLQTVDVKSLKAMSGDQYHEQVILTKTIKANIDMIATHHCKIGNQYAITASIPEGSVNYYPELIQTWIKRGVSDPKIFYIKFWTFQAAKIHCGNRDYSVITIDYRHILNISGGEIVHTTRDLADMTYIVCGTNWKAYFYRGIGDQHRKDAYDYYKHDGRKYVQLYANYEGYIQDWSDYLELQMLQNAMK